LRGAAAELQSGAHRLRYSRCGTRGRARFRAGARPKRAITPRSVLERNVTRVVFMKVTSAKSSF
jgi:hypothetical protein